MKKPIYFDYASTTPVHPDVLHTMLPYFTEDFGNSGSNQHYYGWVADEAVSAARKKICQYFGTSYRQLIFTSGATESNNLAILGFLKDKKPGHLITSCLEHKAVLQVFQALARDGWNVTYLKPNSVGLIDFSDVENTIQADTVLVSLMMVNNETGNLTDFQAISRLCRLKGICFHSDATQAIGKIDLDQMSDLPDMLSFSGHKIYGPKGIGGLLLHADCHLSAINFGGSQERGLRPGTLPVQQIVGLAACFDLLPNLKDASKQLVVYKERILKELLGDYVLNSSDNQSVPHIISLSISNVDWEEMYRNISGIAVANGSACNAKSQTASHVMKALGHSDALALATLRISLSFMTTVEDIDFLISYLNKQIFMA